MTAICNLRELRDLLYRHPEPSEAQRKDFIHLLRQWAFLEPPQEELDVITQYVRSHAPQLITQCMASQQTARKPASEERVQEEIFLYAPDEHAHYEAFVGSVWREDIEDGDPDVVYVHFLPDGEFEFNYSEPGNYDAKKHKWTIEQGQLILDWNEGFCLDRFPLPPDPRNEMIGVQSVRTMLIEFSRVS